MGDSDLATKGHVGRKLRVVAPSVATSITRPTFVTADAGRTVVETDTGNTLWWNGTVFKYVGNRAIVTSSTRPTGSLAYEGLEIYESDTDKTYININGSWVQTVLSTGPAELGYAQVTSNGSNIASSSPVDVSGLSVTVIVGARPIHILGFVALFSTGANDTKILQIREGTTLLGQATTGEYGGTSSSDTLVVNARIAASAGSHTYKLSAYTGTGTTVLPAAIPGDPNFIWVREV